MPRVKHNAIHQFKAGLNNAPENHPAAILPITSPVFQGWKTYYEALTIGATYADDAYWDITVVGTGTLAPGDSQSMKFASKATTINSGYSIRHLVGTVQTAAATKKFYLETIVKLTHTSGSMALNEWFVGWTNPEASHNSGGAAWDFEDGFGFGQLDNSTPVWVTNSGDTEQSIPLSGTLVTATYRKYACYFDGTNYNLYEDDVLITQAVASPAVVADTPLGCQVWFKTGEAKTNNLQVQYALLALEI
ncbi:hypothetical protein LCGC14_2106460 [marine sediment metagenome]|uniref:GH16 domain-containing protein n=1 Tax=marine sediment metagenome TaxID=412755 RepID=A0A0F9GLL2_9ZZZZ